MRPPPAPLQAEWAYRGCVHNAQPSAVLPLQASKSSHCDSGRDLFNARLARFRRPVHMNAACSAALALRARPDCLPYVRPPPGPSLQQWPLAEDGSVVSAAVGGQSVQIGVSLEAAADIVARESSSVGAKAEFAKRVGLDLFRYLESFQTQNMGSHIVVPANALER